MFDPALGLLLGAGLLPAAALGLETSRRERMLVLVVGTVAGWAMFLGSLVAPLPVIAVLTIFALSVVIAVAVRIPFGRSLPSS
ncbi:hypothetical protein [Agromyces salentinus]|uniref:hypothetical protein n=1 Tax=Agromyces salentinus TaxID=269421 RepID=UPI0012FC8F46|nr:hypothetical protein [Agromyces salentinus]